MHRIYFPATAAAHDSPPDYKQLGRATKKYIPSNVVANFCSEKRLLVFPPLPLKISTL